MSADSSYTEGHSIDDIDNVYIVPTAAAASSVGTSSPLHVLMDGSDSSPAPGNSGRIMGSSSPNSLLEQPQLGMVASDSLSRVTLSYAAPRVFCDHDILSILAQRSVPRITNSLFDCSTLGSGTSSFSLAESVATSTLLEVPPLFLSTPDSAPNSLLVKARAGLVTLDTVPLVMLCSRTW